MKERDRERFLYASLKMNFSNPSHQCHLLVIWTKRRRSMEGKGGGKGPSLSPTKYPPDTDLFWGKRLHSCKVHHTRNMAGPLLDLDVAGRPPPLAGRLGVKKAKEK